MFQASQGPVRGPWQQIPPRDAEGLVLRWPRSVWVVIAGCRRRGTNNRILSPQSPDGGTSKIRAPAAFISGGSSLPGSQAATHWLGPRVALSLRVWRPLLSSLTRTLALSCHIPTLMTSFDTVQAFSADPSCHAFCPRGHAQVCPHTPLPTCRASVSLPAGRAGPVFLGLQGLAGHGASLPGLPRGATAHCRVCCLQAA